MPGKGNYRCLWMGVIKLKNVWMQFWFEMTIFVIMSGEKKRRRQWTRISRSGQSDRGGAAGMHSSPVSRGCRMKVAEENIIRFDHCGGGAADRDQGKAAGTVYLSQRSQDLEQAHDARGRAVAILLRVICCAALVFFLLSYRD